jgi:hypothetical protein
MANNLFYCYSCNMKDFLKSQGLRFVTKGRHPKTDKPFFVFEKSEELNKGIKKWNDLKLMK